MPLFFKKRPDILYVGAIPGVATASVLFLGWREELLGLSVFMPFGKIFLVFVYLLPTLLAYLSIYALNRGLIRIFGGTEFFSAKTAALEKLFAAALTGDRVFVDPADLVEEEAWAVLRKYWRPK